MSSPSITSASLQPENQPNASPTHTSEKGTTEQPWWSCVQGKERCQAMGNQCNQGCQNLGLWVATQYNQVVQWTIDTVNSVIIFIGSNLLLLLAILAYYIAIPVCYVLFKDKFLKVGDSSRSNFLWDGLYFASVTFHTVGYGDITPSTPRGELFVMAMIIIVVFLNHKLNSVINFIPVIRTPIVLNGERYVRERVDIVNLRYRVLKLGLSTLVTMAGGAIWLSLIERKDTLKAIYGVVVTSSTVGYGDVYFTRKKWFPAGWILVLVPMTSVFVNLVLELTKPRDEVFKRVAEAEAAMDA